MMRIITHDAFHSGEISLALGSNGLGAIDPWGGMSRPEARRARMASVYRV